MQIRFSGKQAEVPEALRRYTERKLQKRLQHLRHVTMVHVVHATERNWHDLDIWLYANNGNLLRGEGRADNMYNAVDAAIAKLETQVTRRKEEMIGRSRGKKPELQPAEAASAAEPWQEAEALAEGDEEEEIPRQVRTKRVQLAPMAVEDAIEELELLGQQFLMFANGDTGRVNVLYRRDDGDYGLLDPQD